MAAGQYINDDGVALDVTNRQNKYNINFNWDQTTAQIDINVLVSASLYKDSDICNNCVNRADQLGKIQIYNAALKNMNKKFSVQITGKNPKSLGYVADYDAASDRLIVDFTGKDVFMPEVSNIILTL